MLCNPSSDISSATSLFVVTYPRSLRIAAILPAPKIWWYSWKISLTRIRSFSRRLAFIVLPCFPRRTWLQKVPSGTSSVAHNVCTSYWPYSNAASLSLVGENTVQSTDCRILIIFSYFCNLRRNSLLSRVHLWKPADRLVLTTRRMCCVQDRIRYREGIFFLHRSTVWLELVCMLLSIVLTFYNPTFLA